MVTWLNWSQKQLNIDAQSTDPSRYPTDGRVLCSWTVEQFVQAAGPDAGPLLAASLFWLKRPHRPATGESLNLNETFELT